MKLAEKKSFPNHKNQDDSESRGIIKTNFSNERKRKKSNKKQFDVEKKNSEWISFVRSIFFPV